MLDLKIINILVSIKLYTRLIRRPVSNESFIIII